jgi:predicted ferric reductase
MLTEFLGFISCKPTSSILDSQLNFCDRSASMVFMGFLFLHCNFRLTSWYVRTHWQMPASCFSDLFCTRDYIWASAGVYGSAWFARFGLMLFRNGLRHTATFDVLPDRMVRVHIPTQLEWSPGQHYFVRFLDMGAHALTSHPFTVTTLPQSGALEFQIRVRGGMTDRLVSYARKQKSSSVILDGPYGGIHGSLRVYDRVVLLAGGSGITSLVILRCH